MRSILLISLIFSANIFSVEEKNLLLQGPSRHSVEQVGFQEPRSPLWNENYALTLDKAQAAKKPLLIAFMGAGCPWSERLDKEILSEPDFLNTLKNELLFVWLTCPRDSSRSSEQVRTLKEQYEIEEYPTLILLNADQAEMFRMGYLPLSAKEFAGQLQQMVHDYQEISENMECGDLTALSLEKLKTLYIKARDLKSMHYKEKLMQLGLSVDQGTFFLLEKYTELIGCGKKNEAEPLRNTISLRDPKNLEGSQLKLAILDFQTRALKPLSRRATPKSAVKPLLEYVRKFGEKDKENLWKVEMMMAQYLFTKNEVEEALRHASASLQSAPDNNKAEIAATIRFLKTYAPWLGNEKP